MKELKKPQIRFAGFTDDWEQRKLGEIVKITMGQSPSSENYTTNPNDFILVQGNADIKNGFVYPRVWTTEVTKKAQRGALIFSVRAPVGDVAKTNYDVVLGRGVAALNGNEFIYQTLSKMKIDGFWEKLSSGSTFESVNSNDIKNAEIHVPSEKEQTAIGNLFKQLDETIALHQREYEKYKNLKISYLEKMFPKENEQFPELRFPEFADAWEQRKLGEIVEIIGGFAFKSNEFNSGNIPIIRISNILENGDIGGDFVYYAENEQLNKFKTIANDYLIAMSGATTGKVGKINTEAYVNQRVGMFKQNNSCNIDFIGTVIQLDNFKNYLNERWGAGAQPNISLKNLQEYEFLCPSISEQTAIGNFFKQLDETIALHQRKAEKYKQIKQAYLEKMFV